MRRKFSDNYHGVYKPVEGLFRIENWLYLPDGSKILDDEYEEWNLIPNVARDIQRRAIAGEAGKHLDVLAIGDDFHGGTQNAPGDPLPTETGLLNQLFEKAVGTITFPTNFEMFVNVTIDRSEANGTGTEIYTEAAILVVDDEALALKTFPGQTKTSDRELIFEWTIFF